MFAQQPRYVPAADESRLTRSALRSARNAQTGVHAISAGLAGHGYRACRQRPLAFQQGIQERHLRRPKGVGGPRAQAHTVPEDEYDMLGSSRQSRISIGRSKLHSVPYNQGSPACTGQYTGSGGRPPLPTDVPGHASASPIPLMTASWLPPDTKVALIHDWLNQRGGAENVLEVLHDLLGEPPVYTSLYQPDQLNARLRRWDIRTSDLDRLPGAHALRRYLLPLYPAAFARMDLSDLDLVLSIKSAFCLGVRTAGPERRARHVCYCLTPTRFLWDFEGYTQREPMSAPARFLSRRMVTRLRAWEVAAARGIDEFVAISSTVQKRIKTCYGRDAVVIPPPVDTEEFRPLSRTAARGEYFLIVSRLVPYKRIDLAIAAFNQMPDKTLIVAGDGRAAPQLQRRARSNVRFTGYLDRRQVVSLVQACKAFVLPGEEDFGITPVEAMSAGIPVIAYQAGGALDFVEEGRTGVFFATQEADALIEAVQRSERLTWDRERLRRRAQRFDVANFRRRIRDFLTARLA